MIAPYSPNLASVSLNCSIYYTFFCALRRTPCMRTSQNAHKAKFREFPSTQSAEYTSVGGGFQCGASGWCLVVPPSQPNAFTHEPSKRSARIRLLNESAM